MTGFVQIMHMQLPHFILLMNNTIFLRNVSIFDNSLLVPFPLHRQDQGKAHKEQEIRNCWLKGHQEAALLKSQVPPNQNFCGQLATPQPRLHSDLGNTVLVFLIIIVLLFCLITFLSHCRTCCIMGLWLLNQYIDMLC